MSKRLWYISHRGIATVASGQYHSKMEGMLRGLLESTQKNIAVACQEIQKHIGEIEINQKTVTSPQTSVVEDDIEEGAVDV